MTAAEMDLATEARLWDFISAVRAGTAEDCPDAFLFASWLIGSWETLLVKLHVAVAGMTEAEAEAAVDELVDAQRALCGSLAASAVAEPLPE